jgi:uncharacterized membrane protein YoaK (UPF0700 family)
MDRRRSETAFAVCLFLLAGYVDALGFLSLGGLFVSFVSGDSTHFAVSAGRGDLHEAARPIVLVLMFVFGATAGSAVGRLAGARRSSAVLACVCATLAAAGLLHAVGRDVAAAAVMASAMGAQNAAFEGEAGLSALTYVTGILVKTGRQLAAALFGEPEPGLAEHVLMWVGLVSGGALGAVAWGRLHLNGVWIAAAAYSALAIAASRLPRADG